MQRTSNKVFLLAWALGLALPGWAANPSLDAYQRGIDDPSKHSQALRIGKLDIKVDIVGAIAETTIVARFDNPSADLLEGRFSFELPDGAAVTGYALDIGGNLVDGVLVDPLRAKREYQQRVRRRVDPGVANVSRANVFSTTVYPIPGAGSRTIRLRFAAPVHAERGLVFPLATNTPVGNLAIDVRADALVDPPELRLPDNLKAAWTASRDGFALATRVSGQPLSGELRIAPARPRHNAVYTRHASGERFFQILDDAAERPATTTAGQRVRIYWDRSLSRRDDELAAEIALLDKYLAAARPASVDLVTFNSTGAQVQRAAPPELGGILRRVLYRGATSFAVLEKLAEPPADVCLVFSDGVVTIDARRDFVPGCEVFAITSAPDADRGFLRRIARGGGAVFRLGPQTQAQILARLNGGGARVIDAHDENGRPLRFAALEGGTGWAVVGMAPANGAVILKVAGLGREIVERRYSPLDAREAYFSGAGALWAADRVALLGAEDSGHAALVDVSRRFSVASPALSFIVLETPRDYVEAEVAPPANYPMEAMAQYRESKREHDERKTSEANERLDGVISQWEEQRRWWNTKFEPRPPKQVAAKSATMSANAPPAPPPSGPSVQRAAMGVVDAITAADIGAFPDSNQPEALQRVAGVSIEEDSATRMPADGRQRGADISLKMENWSPDRPYLKALDAALPADIDRVLAREERKYEVLPAFYFDVAEWLQRKKRGAEALEMLLSALELPAANEETVSMVADRLLRYGRVDRAIWLYDRVREQSDYLPQPRRTLALALARRASGASPAAAREDLVRAIALLNEIVTTPWQDSYDGIELVALMDVNQLLPKLAALGVSKIPLDERLRALLDVDIRVIIEWNTDATDMDLWVDEPGGERAIYSNPRTALGGRLSNDMTEGLGPEEYLLHRAAPGEYKISVNVYAADSINPNGTTVVTAHLFRNFGRPTQAEETMELELKPDDSGIRAIGNFTVN